MHILLFIPINRSSNLFNTQLDSAANQPLNYSFGGNDMKTAIVVLSDPKANSEEALGRLFNALATAYDFKHKGDKVTLLFQGAGTRWASEVVKADHPAHELYKAVEDTVAGVSCGCADVFGASETARQSGFDLIKSNIAPGTTGLPSLQSLAADGYTLLIF